MHTLTQKKKKITRPTIYHYLQRLLSFFYYYKKMSIQRHYKKTVLTYQKWSCKLQVTTYNNPALEIGMPLQNML